MSYATMSKSVDLTHDKLVNGNWTCKNAEAYLKVNGLNDAVVCAVIENASNVVIFREAEKM